MPSDSSRTDVVGEQFETLYGASSSYGERNPRP